MLINILNFKENKDGSANFDVEYDKEVRDLILKSKKRKRITNKLMTEIVIEGIKNATKTS